MLPFFRGIRVGRGGRAVARAVLRGGGRHPSFFSMKRAFQSSLEWLKKVFEPFGITPARFDMMRAIDSDEFVYQRALQDMLGVSGATVSRMLKALCELGLVESEQDPDDRRREMLGLTE